MKKLLIITLSFITNISLALEVGSFQVINVNPGNENTLLAIIDHSDFSQKWLSQNANYLIDRKIPVLVINSTRQQVFKLNKKHKGLLAGVVPKPQRLIYQLAKQIGITYYPAVVENGRIWQKNPNQPGE